MRSHRIVAIASMATALLLASACTGKDNDSPGQQSTGGNASDTQTAESDGEQTLRASAKSCSISEREAIVFEADLPNAPVTVEVQYKVPGGSKWQPSTVNYSKTLPTPTPSWACFADNAGDNPDPKGEYRMRLTSKQTNKSTTWSYFKVIA